MNESGKPVNKRLEELDKVVKSALQAEERPIVDFKNTEIAFSHKSNQELKKTAWLFGLMNKPWLVGMGSKLGLAAIRMRLPFVKTAVKNTIFEQFCGGTTLLESQKTIQALADRNVLSILDYGAEAKETEEDFNITMNEAIRAIEFSAKNNHVPVISTKLTGLARFGLLEEISENQQLPNDNHEEFRNVVKRMEAICFNAASHGIAVFFDAEESWIQYAIDQLVERMMRQFNKDKVIVYNTFQMYRKDRLRYLTSSYDRAQRDGYLLGAKIVRGAYMDKERERAQEKGYESPIHPTKEATDDAYNTAIRFCVEHYETMASCVATHNAKSCLLQAQLIEEKGIVKNHSHLNFCQLLGMSDHLTFNLAEAGYNVAKYVVYGSVREVLPYLIRRAQENTSVTGDMSREYGLVLKEMKRRGLA